MRRLSASGVVDFRDVVRRHCQRKERAKARGDLVMNDEIEMRGRHALVMSTQASWLNPKFQVLHGLGKASPHLLATARS